MQPMHGPSEEESQPGPMTWESGRQGGQDSRLPQGPPIGRVQAAAEVVAHLRSPLIRSTAVAIEKVMRFKPGLQSRRGVIELLLCGLVRGYRVGYGHRCSIASSNVE